MELSPSPAKPSSSHSSGTIASVNGYKHISNFMFYVQSTSNNNNNILYLSQREIKAVVRSHNEEHILDIRPLSLNLHILISNSKFPGIMFSLSNQNVKTLRLNKNH